jgi:hypothetical protein
VWSTTVSSTSAVGLIPTVARASGDRLARCIHCGTIDHGWQEVAQTALDFVKRFVPAKPS